VSHPLEERSHLSATQAAHATAVFTRVHPFDFYDGPESGIAETATGHIYRFESVGESRHRRFRAYVLDCLTEAVPLSCDIDGFLSAKTWESARKAASAARYIGIGDLWLGRLVVERLSPGEAPPADFSAAHRRLRVKFASSDGRR
jgi:hypothetical protein